MSDYISQKEISKIENIKGEVRGVSLKGDGNFVLKEKGEEGLKKLQEEMIKAGFPVNYRTIRAMNFYPLKLDVVNLILIKRIFNFDDKKLQELGWFLAKSSLVLKLYMKYFASLEKITKQAPAIWTKSYTVGELQVSEVNEKEKYLAIRIKDFKIHALYCQIFIGYFSSVVQMVTGGKISSAHPKCAFEGQDFCEFLIKWE